MMTMFHANSPRRPAKLTSANITRSVFTIESALAALRALVQTSASNNNNCCMTAFIEKTLAEEKRICWRKMLALILFFLWLFADNK
jgi:hypothetical protein